MAEFVLTERKDNIGIVTLNRPEKLNAWHARMKDEIITALDDFDEDESIKVIILTGKGRAWTAGQDLNETKTMKGPEVERWRQSFVALYDRVRSLRKPLIAAMNGVAAGSGFQIAMMADFRIGHSGVRMGQPEINSGIATTSGSCLMWWHLPLSLTIDLTLTGRLMDAEESLRVGLLNKIVPEDQVMAESLKLAELLASKPPVAMRLNKERFREMTELDLQAARIAGKRNQAASYATGEPARMMEKFLQERASRKSGA